VKGAIDAMKATEWKGFTHHFIAKKLNSVIEKNKKIKRLQL
jgi:hypothetical protein